MSRPLSLTKISITTLVVYWLALVGGLVLFGVTRNDEIDLAGMWIGGLGGTAMGQFLASRDLRLWFVCLILAGFLVLCGPFTPLHNGGLLFWMALIPGTVCGWLSLSDRGSLVAFWFPVVIWMLSILDRGQGTLKLESGSAALLGSLAFLFIAFLYARETRRIGLWRTVAPMPLAPPVEPVILKEVPRLRVGLAGWSLVVSAAAFGICAWLAPRLWHVEPLVPDLYAVASPSRPDDARARMRRGNVRCCQDMRIGESKRTRVKEYFDIGRGHHEDEYEEYAVSRDCVVCGPDGLPMDVERHGRYDDGWAYDRAPSISTGPYYGDYGNGQPGYGQGYGEGYRHGTPSYGDSYASRESYTPSPSYTPPSYTPPTYTPPAPTYTPPPTQPEPPPPPTYTPPSYTPPAPMPTTPPMKSTTPQPTPPSDRQARPEITAEPIIEETPSAPAPADVRPPAPSTATTATTTQARASTAPDNAPPVVYWLVVVLASGFAFQLLALGLRPVRRLLTLRHLRKPFWNETVDQQISNYWHLVLVGLRDAGWRTTSGEAPRELAKRLEIESVERAAAILERARHGVGIEATDLAEMGEASEQAYRASRERTSAFARFIGWFRRPLV